MALDQLIPTSLSSLVILIFTSIPTVVSQSTVDDSRCNCYLATGTDQSYYSYHKFFDFRSLDQYVSVPSLVQDPTKTALAPPANDYFSSDNFSSFWDMQTWNNSESLGQNGSLATVLRINSKNNVYIEKNSDPNPASSTFLTLRTARQPAFQSSAELVSQTDGYQFLSMRMLARTVGASGGCTAMFTYRPTESGSKVQEADLEMLTKYPKSQVQCTNQPWTDDSDVSASTQNVTLPGGQTWDNWVTYRMDWTPTKSVWYVNGQEVVNISLQVPRDPARIHLNAWSDGGNWTGIMPFKMEAHLQIQWWELLYNSTQRKPDSNVCHAVCSVDASKEIGKAVMISNSMAAARLLQQSQGLVGLATWIPTAMVLAMLLFSSSILQ